VKNIFSKKTKLYAIIDYNLCLKNNIDIFEFARAYIKGGGGIIQYRDKENSIDKIKSNAFELKNICDDNDAVLIINDYAEIALELNLPVHLGQTEPLDMNKNLYWGFSTHNIEEVKYALKINASYIGFGAMFKSKTKPDVISSFNILEAAIKLWPKEIVLIGGINIENTTLLPSKANIFYAVISDFFRFGKRSDDIQKYTKDFIEKYR